MNEVFGPVQTAEPSITIPYRNPNLTDDDPAQPTQVWINASTDDLFIPVDMVSRQTAVLFVGGNTILPYQQNLTIAPVGAVTVWNPVTSSVDPVLQYTVDGPSVTISNYPDGTAYMVEFSSAPIYAVWKRAGGQAHIRPFGGGTVNEPRRFRLQALDPWLRQRNVQTAINVLPATGNAIGTFADIVSTSDGIF